MIFTTYILPIFGAKTSFWGQNGLEEYGYKVQIATFFNTNLKKNMVIFTTYLLAIFRLKIFFFLNITIWYGKTGKNRQKSSKYDFSKPVSVWP